MKRKLISLLLCAFALLLLMGAGVEQNSAALVIEEESASLPSGEQALETEIENSETQNRALHSMTGREGLVGIIPGLTRQPEPAEAQAEIQPEDKEAETPAPVEVEEVKEVKIELDEKLLVDGQPVPAEVGRFVDKGVTYVALNPMAQLLSSEAVTLWDSATRTATVTAPNLSATAKLGALYVEANGRYLYVPRTVQSLDGRVFLPLKTIAKMFDAQVGWDSATGTATVTRGSGAITPGDRFYDQESLFWLSRIISVESGNQPLEGQMAVGNVVMNRVNSPLFANSVEAVLAQKNQFTTYAGGKLANRTPRDISVIAAKLVLDGGEVEETKGATYFDSSRNSWASRHKTCIAVIGGHSFYR